MAVMILLRMLFSCSQMCLFFLSYVTSLMYHCQQMSPFTKSTFFVIRFRFMHAFSSHVHSTNTDSSQFSISFFFVRSFYPAAFRNFLHTEHYKCEMWNLLRFLSLLHFSVILHHIEANVCVCVWFLVAYVIRIDRKRMQQNHGKKANVMYAMI